MLCIYLRINDYLREEFVPNAHKVNTYLVPSHKASQLTSLSRADIVQEGLGPKLECTFPVRGKPKSAVKSVGRDVAQPGAAPKRKRPTASRSLVQDNSEHVQAVTNEFAAMDDTTYARHRRDSNQTGAQNLHRREGHGRESPIVIDDSDEVDYEDAEDEEDVEREIYAVEDNDGDIEDEDGSDDDWSYSLRNDRPLKKTRLQPYVEVPVRRAPVEDDVISIDSD